MEDLIGLVIFVVFAGLSLLGRVMKNQEKQGGQGRPQFPGPVAGPGIPGGGQSRTRQREGQSPPPWPPQPEGQVPPQWPQPASRPQPSLGQPAPPADEGVGTEGVTSMLGSSLEGRSSMATGTLEENRARFRSQTEEWLRSRVESGLHGSAPPAGVVRYNQQVNPVVEILSRPEGLAQGVLLAEVLGKPRALRPRGRR